MKYNSLKKLSCLLSFVLLASSHVFARVDVKLSKDRQTLNLSLTKRTFFNPIKNKETKKIEIKTLRLEPRMDLTEANKLVTEFRDQVATLGVNLGTMQGASTKEKKIIIRFLDNQQEIMENFVADLKKTLDLGNVMNIQKVQALARKNIKNFVPINYFMRKKWAPARALADRINQATDLALQIIMDLKALID